MIRKLIYLCPRCLAEDSFIQNDTILLCRNCNAKYPFDGKFADMFSGTLPLHDCYAELRRQLTLFKNNEIRQSGQAILRQGIGRIKFTGFMDRVSHLECPQEIDKGIFEITPMEARFVGENKQITFPASEISGFSTSSRYFEFKLKNRPFYQIDFQHESPLKYQDLFVKWMEMFHGKSIVEHQPRLLFEPKAKPPAPLIKLETIRSDSNQKFGKMEKLLHWFVGTPIVKYLRWNGGVDLQGGENIPESGPFVLVANHQSYLDPMILSVILRRRIAFFTKSTSFCDPRLQIIFRAYRSIPNRRYQTDPQVIRNAVWLLKKGQAVGVFPEGERCWDGRLLPLRQNSVRFIFAANVPVVIARISGAYQVLPRWSGSIRRGKITIEILPAFDVSNKFTNVNQLNNYLVDTFSPAYDNQ